MIGAWIFVTTLCCVFSLPITRSSSAEIFPSKRNVRVDPGNSFDEDLVLEKTLEPGAAGDDDEFEGLSWKDIFSSQRLWAFHCPPDCDMAAHFPGASVEGKDDVTVDDDVTPESTSSDAEDIVLQLNADKDLMRFLQWTTSHLSPVHITNTSGNQINPALNAWMGLNLSGRRELPLYVEEPKYIVIRSDVYDLTPLLNYLKGITFISPRGRKFIANLDFLKTRFVPSRGKRAGKRSTKGIFKYNDNFFLNRGKKDTLKDIFKYDDDDQFFPNRGKKFDDTTGELKSPITDHRSYTQLSAIPPPFEDCFTRCSDITSAPMLMIATNRASAACGGGAVSVAECQKQNDVKINGFDQSVKAQIHQQPPSMEFAVIAPLQTYQQPQQQQQQQPVRQRRLSSSSPASTSASVETSASSFLPFIWSDQVHRVPQQPHPIRSGQWRDYYF